MFKKYKHFIIFRDGAVMRLSDGHFFSPSLNITNNTLYVSMWFKENGKTKRISKFVKRLVADAFIPNNENLKNIKHKDNNTKNCHYLNLYRTNEQERKGGNKGIKGELRVKQAKLNNEKVAFIILSSMHVSKLAIKFNVSHPLIVGVKKGYRWKHIFNLSKPQLEALAKKIKLTDEEKMGVKIDNNANKFTNKGVQSIINAKLRDERKIPFRVDNRTTIMIYPNQLNKYKRKYNLV